MAQQQASTKQHEAYHLTRGKKKKRRRRGNSGEMVNLWIFGGEKTKKYGNGPLKVKLKPEKLLKRWVVTDVTKPQHI